MLKKFYLLIALSLLLLPIVHAKKPNVIFIITDDQFREEYGYLGGKAITPNLDRIAKEGVILTNGYSSTSVCTPSRYTSMTGRYASRCTDPFFDNDTTKEGMVRVRWNVLMNNKENNLPKILQANGYKTALFGKWHMGIPNWGPEYTKNTPKKGDNPSDPKVKKQLSRIQELTCDGLKSCGFDVVDRVYSGNLHDEPWLTNTGCDTHNPEWITEGAINFLEEQDKEQPFFMWFSLTLMHVPDPMESLRSADPRITPVGYLDTPIKNVQPSRASVIERTQKAGLSGRVAAATWADDSIGAILKKLDEMGITDDTLIVYTDDHGMENNSKGSCYQGGIVTPMLVSWPSKIKPQSCDALIQNTDFTPTILDACDIEIPEGYHVDGRSFLPILNGETPKDWRTTIYSEIGFTRSVNAGKWKYIAFRIPESERMPLEKRLKLQEAFLKKAPHLKKDPEARTTHLGLTPGGDWMLRGQFTRKPPFMANYYDEDQLYNLEDDPLETKNLAKDPEHAEKLKEMKKLLKTYLNQLPGTFAELKPEA